MSDTKAAHRTPKGGARYVLWAGKILGALANFLLSAMVIITCIDVTGRYFFSAPLIGAHEMITLAMGIMIFLGMPLVTSAREHLTVDIMGGFLGPWGRRVHQIFVNLVAALTFILFAYLLWFHGIGLTEDLMITQDFEIEQAPFAFLMAAMCFLTIFVFLNHLGRDLTGKGPDYSRPASGTAIPKT